MRWWPAFASIAWVTLASRAAFADEAPEPAHWGLQLGGPGVLELMLRPRIAGPVLLEVGALGYGTASFLGNASLGFVVELEPPAHRRYYLAFGAAAAGGCGEGEEGLGCGGIVYGYTRVGLEWHVGEKRPSSKLVTLDVGAWLGTVNNDDRGYRRFLIPMVGVGYYWSTVR